MTCKNLIYDNSISEKNDLFNTWTGWLTVRNYTRFERLNVKKEYLRLGDEFLSIKNRKHHKGNINLFYFINGEHLHSQQSYK